MTEVASTYLDKTDWIRGPWDNEPDRLEFEHAGFPCLALRHDHFGSWCGYVALPPSHPWAAMGFDDIPADVHGGFTYGAATCGSRICHKPKPGEPDDVRWIGFDCNHLDDLAPATEARRREFHATRGYATIRHHDVYRDLEYVKDQCCRVADQAQRASVIL